MLKFLKNIFQPNKNTVWDEYTLVKNMRKWQDSSYYPLKSSLPDVITFSDKFWNQATSIYKYTYKDGLEHAFSAWSIYKQVFYTKVQRGTKTKVTTQDRVQVKFDSYKAGKYIMRIFVNGDEVEKRTLDQSQIKNNQADSELRFLFNLHTHPHHENPMTEEPHYSYYSRTDINSFFSSKAAMTGLITDKISLLFKTRETPKEHGLGQSQPTNKYLYSNLHLAEYLADFDRKRFYRIDQRANTHHIEKPYLV